MFLELLLTLVTPSVESVFFITIHLDDPSDVEAFKRWVVNIALSSFLYKPVKWHQSQRDCAGFVRYVFKEALKKHDNLRGVKLIRYDIPDVKKYNYPNIPLFADKLFMTDRGPSTFANGYQLVTYNFVFISKNVQDAKPADILVFFNKKNLDEPFHIMLFLGKKVGVIYHTGDKRGLNKLTIKELLNFPDPYWRPIPPNNMFLGVYRWKGITW